MDNQRLNIDSIRDDFINPIKRRYGGVRIIIGLPHSLNENVTNADEQFESYEHVDTLYFHKRYEYGVHTNLVIQFNLIDSYFAESWNNFNLI